MARKSVSARNKSSFGNVEVNNASNVLSFLNPLSFFNVGVKRKLSNKYTPCKSKKKRRTEFTEKCHLRSSKENKTEEVDPVNDLITMDFKNIVNKRSRNNVKHMCAVIVQITRLDDKKFSFSKNFLLTPLDGDMFAGVLMSVGHTTTFLLATFTSASALEAGNRTTFSPHRTAYTGIGAIFVF
jgi:hypothetical protein